MDLLTKHVGGQASTVGAGSPDRYGYCHIVTLMRLAAIFTAPEAGRTDSSAYYAGSNSLTTS
jgi:hypothetical protein